VISINPIGTVINVLIQGVTRISGTLQSVGPTPIEFQGDFDFTNANVTGLNNGSFANSIFTGVSTFQGPTVFEQAVDFNLGFDASLGTAVMGDQSWANGSVINVLGTTTFTGPGSTLDFTGLNLVGLPPTTSMVNGTLSGNTTINGNVTWNTGTVTVPGPLTFTGAGPISFSGVGLTLGSLTWSTGTVTVPGPLNFTGVGPMNFSTVGLTLGSLTWNTGTVAVPGPLAFTGVGPMNFAAVGVTLPKTSVSVAPTIFPWAAPINTTFRVARFGEIINVVVVGVAAAATANNIISYTAAIPVGYRPNENITKTIIVIDNTVATLGRALFFVNGDVEISVIPGPAFTAAGFAAFDTFGAEWNIP
jgi:hypothetical protein